MRSADSIAVSIDCVHVGGLVFLVLPTFAAPSLVRFEMVVPFYRRVREVGGLPPVCTGLHSFKVMFYVAWDLGELGS